MDKNKTIKKQIIMKKAIAMKCSEKDWDSIKGRVSKNKINSVFNFEKYDYLTITETGKISNINRNGFVFIWDNLEEIHETFNAKIFLNACGIDCDVYEITKGEVQYLYQLCNSDSRDYLHKKFPDAFKKELEAGKWYKDKDPRYKGLICIEKYNGENNGITAYGFSWVSGSFDGNSRWCPSKESKDDLIEATPQEVEAALILEWEKLGGVGLDLHIELNGKEYQLEKEVGKFQLIRNILFYQGAPVMNDGQWATIIQPEKMTLEQIEKELGRKIELI